MNQHPTYERIDYTVKETAAALRKALREAFPGVRFSVRMSRGTAYGWLDVHYSDGPTWEQVRRIAHGFQRSQFDGMDDSYKSIEPTLYVREDGTMYEQRWGSRGVNVSRDYSPEVTAWAESVAVRGSCWWSVDVDAWRDSQDLSRHELLAGLDLTDGIPADPAAAWTERYDR